MNECLLVTRGVVVAEGAGEGGVADTLAAAGVLLAVPALFVATLA
jgi:hypothetical protein